jgi:3-dehydroquinate synthase
MSDDVTLNVGLEEHSYPIHIGARCLDALPDYLSQIYFPSTLTVITNDTVNNLFGDILLSILEDVGNTVSIITIEDGEQYKSFSTLSYIYDELVSYNVDRSSGIIAFGGGVVGDIAGFAAATFMRGIPYVQVPTTLLSQVDSSVGGKTAINHPTGKNLIGAFNQPKLVCIDVELLNSLPDREFNAGIAEVIKYGVIRDKDFFNWLRNNRELLIKKDRDALIYAIKTSCQIKADVVEIDEKESSLRAILNYGHTFGHAVESLTGYQNYLHGEAVSIGMVFAAKAAADFGYCAENDVAEITSLLSDFNLPVEVPDFSVTDYMEAMMHDKKVKGGQLNMIFNVGIGDCKIVSIEHPEEILRKNMVKQVINE